MDRTIIAPLEQMRAFDFAAFEHDVLVGLASLCRDILSQTTGNIVAGLAATQTTVASLTINIGAGSIYSSAPADATATGSIVQDLTGITQQGRNPGQTVTVTAPSVGQSQWWLIQCQFSQVDLVRSGDPNGGIVPFFNVANPTVPIPTSINTERQGLLVIQALSGSAATTGSQVPPQPSTNWTPLYLINVAGGQTQITTAQILKAGPSVGPNVASNYPVAPFLAGFLAAHHNGNLGQAPKINLTSEVQGILPYINMAPVRQQLGSNLTLFVNASTGNDSNGGLSPSTPFLTIQAAANAAYHNYDFNGNALTISVANGAYNVSPGAGGWALQMFGLPLGCPSVTLVGNIASPGSVTIAVTNGNGILASLGCFLTIQGITITASGTILGFFGNTGVGIVANASWVNLQNCVMGACGVYQTRALQAGMITNNGQPMTFTGATQISCDAETGGVIWLVGSTLTVTGLTMSSAFVNVAMAGTGNFVGCTFVGSATGPRYLATLNGVINTGGGGANFLPGSTAGSVGSGGQYA